MQSLNDIIQFAQNNATAFAATGVIGVSMWSRIKEIPGKIIDLIKSRVLYTIDIKQNTLAYMHVEEIMRNKAITTRYTNFVIDADQRAHNLHKTGTLVYEGVWRDELGNYSNVYDKINIDDGTFIIVYKGILFIVSKTSEKRNVKNTDVKDRAITLTALTLKRDKALIIIRDYFDSLSKPDDYTHLYKNNDKGWYHAIRRPAKSFDSLFYNDGLIENLVDKIKTFKESEKEYEKFGVPHKLIVCLEGPPGTGKTSLFLALCGHFKVNARFLNLANVLSDEELLNMMDNNGSFILIDDVDADTVNLNRRSNMHLPTDSNPNDTIADSTTTQADLTRSYRTPIGIKDVLQLFDGHFSPNGTIIFFNTNRFNNLDDAVTRRCDVVTHVGYIDRNVQVRLAKFYGSDWAGSSNQVQPSKLSMMLRQKASTEELDKAFN